MPTIRFVVPGPPQAEQRHRTVGGRKTIDVRTGQVVRESRPRTYTPKETVDYQQVVAWTAKAAARGHQTPIVGPVEVRIDCYLKRPRKPRSDLHGDGWPTGRPDWDNFAKAIQDGINRSGIWGDDSQVIHGETWKLYADDPCAVVVIRYGEAVDFRPA